jgi:acyl phosphate:glycerol-3-phosphate acyltransferase
VSHFAVALICGYLIGSIPTAYLIVRLFTKKDIRLSGSGNVGAANTLKVTKSKSLGILVAVFDILKGVAAFVIGMYVGGNQFIIAAVAGVAAVAGHNFPVWLRFRGGRGLATAAGFVLPWIWPAPFVWLGLWVLLKKITGNTHISNIVATGILLIIALAAKNEWLIKITTIAAEPGHIRIAALMLCGLIFIKHIEPIITGNTGRME